MAAGFFGLNPEIEEGVRLAILQEYLDNIPDDMSDELDGLPDLDSDYEEEYAPRRAPRAAPDSPTGGYDCQFVGDLPDALQCLICTVAAKDPQQLDCCGKIFCKNCLDHLNMSANTSCPNCRDKKWKSFPDKKSKWLKNPKRAALVTLYLIKNTSLLCFYSYYYCQGSIPD